MEMRSTNSNIDIQKYAIYRKIYDIPTSEEIELECWQKFSIPYIREFEDGSAQVVYECTKVNALYFYDTTTDAIANGCRPLDDITKENLGRMDLCMRCPHRIRACQ